MYDALRSWVAESFQLQMGFSFPLLRANNLRTSLLIMRTYSLSYVGLFINLIANAVNNNDQHVRYGKNVRMSKKPHLRQKRMGTGIIIARRTTKTFNLVLYLPGTSVVFYLVTPWLPPCHF